MSRLFVGNFSFEQAWDRSRNPSRQVDRFEAELACIWLAVATEGDEILCPESIDPAYWERMISLGCPRVRVLSQQEFSHSQAREIVPWGWTPAIRQLAQRLKIPVHAPPQELIWTVNSRSFAFEVSSELGITLSGEGIAKSLPETLSLLSKLGESAAGWIIKPNQGQAGRGQMRGDQMPNKKESATLARLLQHQGAVHVEPQLEKVLEIGCQWEIPIHEAPQLLGIAQLLTNDRGEYCGSALNAVEIPEPARENLLKSQAKITARLQAMGYFGPVGIDGMLYRNENSVIVRPVQDINARWTMGRIALEWGRQFEGGSWLHASESPSETAVRLSPENIAGTPVRHATWWSV